MLTAANILEIARIRSTAMMQGLQLKFLPLNARDFLKATHELNGKVDIAISVS